MNLSWMLPLLLASSMAQAQMQAPNATACQPVQPRKGGGAVLADPGRYCVTRDMLVDSHYQLFAHGSPYKNDDRILMLLASSHIVLDLQQHTVTANAAVRAAVDSPGKDWLNYPDAGKAVLPANVVIRNGTIRVTKRAGLAMGIKILSTPDLPLDVASDLTGSWRARDGGSLSASSAARAQRWVEEVRAALPARPQDYAARKVLIEQVQIESAAWGIGVEGAGTVIRNSTIEVDAGTALWIYGPNAVIENNTIIVNGKATVVEADAAIRLHHGDGAVIRNNRIIVKGDAHPWAISAFRTGPFTLEGNTLNGKAMGKEGVRVWP